MLLDNSTSEKRFWLIMVFLTLLSPVIAQEVRNENGTINSRKYSGFSVLIEDNHVKVSEFWQEELKKVGKLRRKRDFHQVEELRLPDEYHPEAIYYTRVIDRDSLSCRIWIALDPETLLAGEEGIENVNLALDKFMSSIPTSYDAYLIQLQILDAERAITFTDKQQQKLMQDIKNLEYQLEESKAERERLLQTIDNLELEILSISQKIEDSKEAVEQSHIDLEKINKMLDQYRQDLKKLQ
jgi:hypothetical protein